MTKEFTQQEIALAKAYASQIEQLGISAMFCDAHVSGDEKFVKETIEVAATEWQRKIEKIQSICNTRDGAVSTIADLVRVTIDNG